MNLFEFADKHPNMSVFAIVLLFAAVLELATAWGRRGS